MVRHFLPGATSLELGLNSFTTHQHANGHTKHKTFTPRTHHTRFIQMLADMNSYIPVQFGAQTNCELAPLEDHAFHTELCPRGFFLIHLPNCLNLEFEGQLRGQLYVEPD